MSYHILIAEDDKDIVDLIKLYLGSEGYTISSASDGEAAYACLEREDIDLLICDIMMPKMNGWELIRRVREKMKIPIIILSAKSEDSDKILGLDLGADDYLSKPFNPLELKARVRSALRRSYSLNEATRDNEGILTVGRLTLDTRQFVLKKDGQEISLTPTEFKILSLLMENPGQIFSRTKLYESINGEYFENDDNTMMVHISKLREKLEDDPRNPQILKTIRGLGYRIEKEK